jgi:hypothetical protein
MGGGGLALALGLAGACAVGLAGACAAAGGGGDPTGGAAGVAGVAGNGGAGTTGIAGGGAAGTGACTGAPTVHVAWTIADATTGAPLTCDQVGATTVEMFLDAARSEFSCSADAGTTAALMPGTYTPRVLLTGSEGAMVVAQGDLPSVTVPSCGLTTLRSIRFLLSAGSTGAAGGGGAAGATGAAGTGGAAGASGAAGTGGGTGPCNALPIFATHNCTVAMACHDANGAAAGFAMTASGWEKTLVGRLPKAGGAAGLGSACLAAGTPYLVAGSNPARGLFLEKLNKPPCGQQMPLLPPDLTPAELDCVQRWANGLTAGK